MTGKTGRGWTRLSRAQLRSLAETLLIGLAGGALANALHLPAAWLTGSMLAVAIAAIRHRPMFIPYRAAQGSFVVMGLAIGAMVTPETLRGIVTWPLSIAMLIIAMLSIIAGTSWYLRRVHGIDPMSAMLAAFPGSMAQVLVLSAHNGVDARAVAVIQSLRVLVLSISMPYAVLLFGVGEPTTIATVPGRHDGSPMEIVLLLVLCAGGAWLLRRLRFPGGLVLGSMLCAVALYGSGVVSAVVPHWMVIAVMVTTGAITGSRFANTDAAVLKRLFIAAIGSLFVATAIAAAFAIATSMMVSVRTADLVLAFSPGALDVNLLLAIALGLDPIYIGAHHVARVTFVSFCLPILIRAAQRRAKRKL